MINNIKSKELYGFFEITAETYFRKKLFNYCLVFWNINTIDNQLISYRGKNDFSPYL